MFTSRLNFRRFVQVDLYRVFFLLILFAVLVYIFYYLVRLFLRRLLFCHSRRIGLEIGLMVRLKMCFGIRKVQYLSTVL